MAGKGERSSLPSKNFLCISMDMLQRAYPGLVKEPCVKIRLKNADLGKVSWQISITPWSIGVTRKAG